PSARCACSSRASSWCARGRRTLRVGIARSQAERLARDLDHVPRGAERDRLAVAARRAGLALRAGHDAAVGRAAQAEALAVADARAAVVTVHDALDEAVVLTETRAELAAVGVGAERLARRAAIAGRLEVLGAPRRGRARRALGRAVAARDDGVAL